MVLKNIIIIFNSIFKIKVIKGDKLKSSYHITIFFIVSKVKIIIFTYFAPMFMLSKFFFRGLKAVKINNHPILKPKQSYFSSIRISNFNTYWVLRIDTHSYIFKVHNSIVLRTMVVIIIILFTQIFEIPKLMTKWVTWVKEAVV